MSETPSPMEDARLDGDATFSDVAEKPAEPAPMEPINASNQAKSEVETPSPDEARASAELSQPEKPAESVATATAKTPKGPARGTILNGRVIEVEGDFVLLDVQLDRHASMPIRECDNGTPPTPGTSVDVVVASANSNNTHLRVHRKGTVEGDLYMLVPGTVVEGTITGMIKGGLEMQCGITRCFMPASQVDTHQQKDISVLLGQEVRAEVLEADRKHKKLIVSRRKLLNREKTENIAKLLSELKVGQVRKGVVTNLAEFGAFVDLGGLHGLVHISDMRWTPVDKPEDVVKPGDEVEVKVLKVNKERKRISLGMKQAAPNPWTTVEEKFPLESKVNAKVVKLTEYGAFAEVADGVNGLIPLSEMSWTHRPAKAEDVVQLGQEVEVMVIGVDAKRHRISLSLRRLQEDPWKNVAEAFTVDSVVTGRVTKLLDFGVLVELKEGVEGMIHISELAHERVKTPNDVVKVGEDVSVKVLKVDMKKRRVSLSIKATTEAPEGARPAEEFKPKKRKKPLRGGLSSHFEW